MGGGSADVAGLAGPHDYIILFEWDLITLYSPLSSRNLIPSSLRGWVFLKCTVHKAVAHAITHKVSQGMQLKFVHQTLPVIPDRFDAE